MPPLDAVLEMVRSDARHGRLAAWGASTVVDENTGTAVIDEDLFDALHQAAGLAADFPVGNAGLLHVYGYWFSTTPTPYGLKRDRWADGRLAAALGLSPNAFHLHARGSTPLQRVTSAALPLLVAPGRANAGTAEVVADGHAARVALHRAAGAEDTALVYGVAHAASGIRLVTTFPVAGPPAPLLEEFRVAPRLRWNAVAIDS